MDLPGVDIAYGRNQGHVADGAWLLRGAPRPQACGRVLPVAEEHSLVRTHHT